MRAIESSTFDPGSKCTSREHAVRFRDGTCLTVCEPLERTACSCPTNALPSPSCSPCCPTLTLRPPPPKLVGATGLRLCVPVCAVRCPPLPCLLCLRRLHCSAGGPHAVPVGDQAQGPAGGVCAPRGHHCTHCVLLLPQVRLKGEGGVEGRRASVAYYCCVPLLKHAGHGSSPADGLASVGCIGCIVRVFPQRSTRSACRLAKHRSHRQPALRPGA